MEGREMSTVKITIEVYDGYNKFDNIIYRDFFLIPNRSLHIIKPQWIEIASRVKDSLNCFNHGARGNQWIKKGMNTCQQKQFEEELQKLIRVRKRIEQQEIMKNLSEEEKEN